MSFGVSGIYLSFLLTVIAAIIARRRGWRPQGQFRLGRWAWPVTVLAGAYLALMLLNVALPTGLTSPRGYFNLDWITLLVMVAVAAIGALVFLLSRPERYVRQHLVEPAEQSGAQLGEPQPTND